jgi:drug/metabolite transporter (DMT)-like permease
MSAMRRSMLLMVAFVALWATVEALAARVLMHYSPYQVVWTRYGVHLAFMVAVWGWRQPSSLWHTRRPAFQLGRSMLMLGMPASWAIASSAGMDPSTVMSVFWLSPLLILVFARLFLGEKAPGAIWLVCAIACAGALMFTPPGPVHSVPMLVFPVIMAVTFSLYVVMTRSLRSENTRTNLFYTALGVFVVLTPLMPHVWVMPTLRDMALLTGVGLLGYVGLLALDRLAAAAPVSVAAPLAYLQIVFTVAIAAGFGAHRVAPMALAGLLVIAATALYLWARAPRLTVVEAV